MPTSSPVAPQPMNQTSQMQSPVPAKKNTLKIVLIVVGILLLFLCVGCFAISLFAQKSINSAKDAVNRTSTQMTELAGSNINNPTTNPNDLGFQRATSIVNNLCKAVNAKKNYQSYFSKDARLSTQDMKAIDSNMLGCVNYIGDSYSTTDRALGKLVYSDGTIKSFDMTLRNENNDYKIISLHIHII